MSLNDINGRQTFLGPFDNKQEKYGIKYTGTEKEVDVEYLLEYDNLPVADVDNEMLKAVPAGAQIVSAKLFVTEAWAGGTSISYGAYKKSDGTAIDADGYDAAIATASLTAGAVIEGDGALIGASVGTDAAVLGATASGTYTAGKAKVILTYIPVDGDVA